MSDTFKVIGKPKGGFELDVKRFYVSGVKFRDVCPKCGYENTLDLDRQYLSYPIVGENSDAMYCVECGNEWHISYNLEIKLTQKRDNK